MTPSGGLSEYAETKYNLKKAKRELANVKYEVYLQHIQSINKSKEILKTNLPGLSDENRTRFIRHIRKKQQIIAQMEQEFKAIY